MTALQEPAIARCHVVRTKLMMSTRWSEPWDCVYGLGIQNRFRRLRFQSVDSVEVYCPVLTKISEASILEDRMRELDNEFRTSNQKVQSQSLP